MEAASEPDWDDAVIRDMKGKTIPQIGRVEISVMEEEQSRWLAFQQKELDLLAVPCHVDLQGGAALAGQGRRETEISLREARQR